MAYDPVHKVTLLYGGYQGPNKGEAGDTWSWDGRGWTRLNPRSSPGNRMDAVMFYDPSSQSIVLYGGGGINGLGADTRGCWTWQTWRWTGSDWLQLRSRLEPQLCGASAAYDPLIGRVVMLGQDKQSRPQMWEWDGAQWVRVTAGFVPPVACAHCVAYDATHKQLLAVAPMQATTQPHTAIYTFTWMHDTWAVGSPLPAENVDLILAYAPGQRGAILVEGPTVAGGPEAELLWNGQRWARVATAESVTGRSAPAVTEASGGRVLLFGGVVRSASGGPTFLNDLWDVGGPAPDSLFAPGPVSTTGFAEYSVFGGRPWALTVGSDHNLWFTERAPTSHIGRITPQGRETEFPIGVRGAVPTSIASGPDGNLWFTLAESGRVGRITPAGKVTVLPAPTGIVHVFTVVSDGRYLWVSAFGPGSDTYLERLTPNGAFKLFRLRSTPIGLAVGRDGLLWFTSQDSVGHIDAQGELRTFNVPAPGLNPALSGTSLSVGPDGEMWFVGNGTTRTAGAQQNIWEVSHVGNVRMVATLPPIYSINAIALGPDNQLWFLDIFGNRLGSYNGSITVYDVPSKASNPLNLVVGPDGDLWFTESGVETETRGRIGRFSLTGA